VAFDVEGFVGVLTQGELDLLQTTGGVVTDTDGVVDGGETATTWW